jgi:hypothetical protein
MARPDPIKYAERLYGAIRAANFSPISFLAFGNAVKEGVPMRNMPRIAAEPFMRVVGEMLDLEEATAGDDLIEAAVVQVESVAGPVASAEPPSSSPEEVTAFQPIPTPPTSTTPAQSRVGGKRGGAPKAP